MEPDNPPPVLRPVVGPLSTTMGSPYHGYSSTFVIPCAWDGQRSLPYHLLSCGHIVIIDENDTRCALNCLSTVNYVREQSEAAARSQPHRTCLPLAHITLMQDELYCEQCVGIPFESHQRLSAGAVGHRRAYGITRSLLTYFTPYDIDEIGAVISPLFANPNQYPVGVNSPHLLRCGHEVWCDPVRPCGANCQDEPACMGRLSNESNVKQSDAILCMECIFRVELVHLRYLRLERWAAQHDAQVKSRSSIPSGHSGYDSSNFSSGRGGNGCGANGSSGS